ncbi:prolyl 3-hydroxylase 2 isoform X1 [Clupea harengus]|uniref:procollagen-proline 3-dioxygenase n=1 Tax=Clupea harengus TaxID=7950 RepID=A0A6P8FTH7_CLUHA|nr:prolyl 3-hydroxylase 2 isoform X1 [Clupea harengus]
MDMNSYLSGTLLVIFHSILLSSAAVEPFDLLYDNAIDAFHSGDYENVVRYMEGALSSFAKLRHTKVRCRLKCKDKHRFDADPFSDLKFFDVILRRASCLNDCMENKLGPQSMHKVSEDVIQDFNRRIPYNYLQMAYLKLKELDKAATAAHTYFQANPEHVEMGRNLEQYKNMKGVDSKHFMDREARPHQKAFAEGVKLYEQDQYGEAITFFEEALTQYFKADLECRALCEGPQRFVEQDHVLYRYSLYELISDHYTQVLHCEHECVRDLATRPGRLSPMENYLPLHYDYLQFAFFKESRFQEALACAQSYLLFHAGDEFMTDNVEYYQEVLGHSAAPREDADWYVKRHQQELELLKVGSQNMGVEYTEGNYWSSSGGREDSKRIPSGTDGWMEYVPISEKKNGTITVVQELKEGGPLLYDNVKLIQNSEALNGTQRVLLDDVISEDECTELKSLAHAVTMAGDGYRGKMSPHTPNEKFEGATVLKTLQFGYEGRVSLKSARMFYDVSEKARKIIESYFMLNSTLHFSYTHLVCRTAITGQQDHRNDLSHPIHADNCLLDPEANECWKEPPAYTCRDYSALLYLNGDFEGGEFIFTEMDAKTLTAQVKPRCGRMVGFSSGGENPHGVRAVTKGQRCAVALWFTLDPLFRELERLQADEVIEALDKVQHSISDIQINPKDEL